MSCLINRFHRHATGERSIANECDNMVIFAFFVASDGHTECGGKRSRRVAGTEGVVFRFVSTQEAADAAVLFDGGQQFAPPGKNLVRVSLMSNVPHETIFWRLKGVMESDGQFHRAKRGACMATHTRHRL